MSQTESQDYFNLHITGIGYLNRARAVCPNRGTSFLAVDIAALHGATNAVEYTRFDCRVSGKEAQRVVQILMPHIELGQKVLVGFKLGDLYADTFVYEKGERTGTTGVSLKARLLRIAWAKVDSKTVYTATWRAEESGERRVNTEPEPA